MIHCTWVNCVFCTSWLLIMLTWLFMTASGWWWKKWKHRQMIGQQIGSHSRLLIASTIMVSQTSFLFFAYLQLLTCSAMQQEWGRWILCSREDVTTTQVFTTAIVTYFMISSSLQQIMISYCASSPGFFKSVRSSPILLQRSNEEDEPTGGPPLHRYLKVTCWGGRGSLGMNSENWTNSCLIYSSFVCRLPEVCCCFSVVNFLPPILSSLYQS